MPHFTSNYNVLLEIVNRKRQDIWKLYISPGFHDMRSRANTRPWPMASLFQVLQTPGLHVIAEMKRSSPSGGVLRKNYDPVAVANEYAAHRVDAYSILTERHYFQGDIAHVTQVRQAFKTPILRKDFILDPLQIFESAAHGADAVLMMLSTLTDDQFSLLHQLADLVGLEVLCEIHDETELERLKGMDELKIKLIGINNRDMKTLQTDVNTTLKLAPKVRNAFKNVVLVAESGYANPAQLTAVKQAGVNAVLVGEALVKNPALLDHFNKSE